MSRIVLDEGGLRVVIRPEIGAGLASFSWRVPGRGLIPLMREAPETVSWFNDLACYTLAPWSNRISNASFEWRHKSHQLAADWPDGTAIHGLVKNRRWTIAQRSPASAVLSCRGGTDYPWPFSVEVCYELSGSTLRVSIALTSDRGGSQRDPMPAGLGFHPFWRRALSDGPDDVRVRLQGLKRYPCEMMIPLGPAEQDDICRRLAAGTQLQDLHLDDVFAGSCHGAEITWPRDHVRVRYACSSALGHTVLFTGMPASFCLEPVSMVNDGFNLLSRGWPDTGVVALAPGDTLRATWEVHVDTI